MARGLLSSSPHMPNPISPNDVLREILPRQEPSHAGPTLARAARANEFAHLLKQAFSPPPEGMTPAGESSSLAGAAISRETIAAMDGDHAGTSASPQRDDGDIASDDCITVDNQSDCAATQAPAAAQPSSRVEYTLSPGRELTVPGNATPVDALPANSLPPSAHGTASTPAGSTVPPGPNAAPGFAEIMSAQSHGPSSSPSIGGARQPELPPLATPVTPQTAPRPATPSQIIAAEPAVAHSTSGGAEHLIAVPQASTTNPVKPGIPDTAPMRATTPTAAPSSTNAPSDPVIGTQAPASQPAAAAPLTSQTPLPMSPPAPAAAHIDAAIITAAAAALPQDAPGTERIEPSHDSGTRPTAHPASAFAAQLAQHSNDPVEPALAPTQMVSDAQTRAVAHEPTAEDDTLLAKDPPLSATSSTTAAISDTNTSRINAATSPDQTALRTARLAAHPAIAQVAIVVTKAAQDGVDRITIKLQPPELGRIDVRLDVNADGRIQAVFAAERSSTVDILQRDVRELERALQSAGLSTDPGGLSFGLKQQNNQNMPRFGASPVTTELASVDTDAAIAAFAAAAARAAADGRLDIHV